MLYLKSAEGALRIIVLESANLDEIRQGHPAHTPDHSVLIAWTPDPVWLANRLQDTGGDSAKILALIDEAAQRPEQGPRPYHSPVHRKLGGKP